MPAITIGQEAPDFTARTNSGRTITLSEFRGKKNVVLVMYPGDQTADCTRQLCAFRDEFPRFVDAETEVFGVNPADADSHQRFVDANGFPFELIVDEKRNIAQMYDSVMLMGFVVKRTVIAIDKAGKIVFFKRGYPTNDEILSALRASNSAQASRSDN
ncbi:MAG: peroxiredoxin [Phototrophicales bacterium]|nr:MAG: peroxiredoxin [Phototrophicales bacterium]